MKEVCRLVGEGQDWGLDFRFPFCSVRVWRGNCTVFAVAVRDCSGLRALSPFRVYPDPHEHMKPPAEVLHV